MRKTLSTLLLLVLGLPMVPPLLAQVQASRTGMLVCCRRTGRHQCAMMQAHGGTALGGAHEDGTHQIGAPVEACPCSPRALAASHADALHSPVTLQTVAVMANRPAGVAQTECKWRIARDRSRQKRGPPSMLLS